MAKETQSASTNTIRLHRVLRAASNQALQPTAQKALFVVCSVASCSRTEADPTVTIPNM
jgi:hypothetical protein